MMLQRRWQTCIVLFIFMFSDASDAYVGISIGTDNSNSDSISEIISILQSHKIKHVRLFDTNHQILEALANTGIEVMVSIPNDQIRGIGESRSKAAEWVNKNIEPFVPSTNIKCIAVGDEVLNTVPDMAPILVPAMKYLHSALLAADLDFQIKISSPQSMEMILEPLPPSSASFNSTSTSIMYYFLDFLKNTGSSFMLNAHPNIYDLFQPVPSSKQIRDPKTLIYYSNMFDAIVDAAHYSMEALNFSGIPILLTESGWQESMIENSLIWHMLSNSGTPSRPNTPVNIYINQFFDEELQHELASGRMMYSLDFQTVSHFVTEAAGTANFCVASQNADTNALMAGLNWACGPGRANCSSIQPGQPCYSNSLPALASYAYNDYYQRTQATGGTCNFNNTAVLTSSDPSHGSCIFTGSSGTGSNTGGGGGNTNSSSGGGGSVAPNPPSFGPSSFVDSGSSLQLTKLSYLVVPVILLSWLTM